MSCSRDGKHLHCDAPDCCAQTDAPVALPPPSAEVSPASARWLYVQRNGKWQHFCPAHSGMLLFAPGDCSSPSAPSALHKLLIVVDNSEAARLATEKTVARLIGLSDALVTLLFSACARCMPPSESAKNADVIPLESYCPGTQKAIAKVIALFENANIAVCLQVQPAPQISERVSEEAARGKYDAIIVSLAQFSLPLPRKRATLPLLPARSLVA